MVDYNLFNETIKTVPRGYYETTEDNTENNPAVFEPVSTTAPQQGGNSPVSVNVSVSPEFVINGTEGQSEADIMAIIKKNMKSMADELGGEIAERLERVFENMPTVRGVAHGTGYYHTAFRSRRKPFFYIPSKSGNDKRYTGGKVPVI